RLARSDVEEAAPPQLPSVPASPQPAPALPPMPVPGKSNVAMTAPQERELRQKLKELRDHVTKNAQYVGQRFSEEARKMHYGEIEHRSIYGEASPDDAKALHEEGIEFHPLPLDRTATHPFVIARLDPAIHAASRPHGCAGQARA